MLRHLISFPFQLCLQGQGIFSLDLPMGVPQKHWPPWILLFWREKDDFFRLKMQLVTRLGSTASSPLSSTVRQHTGNFWIFLPLPHPVWGQTSGATAERGQSWNLGVRGQEQSKCPVLIAGKEEMGGPCRSSTLHPISNRGLEAWLLLAASLDKSVC